MALKGTMHPPPHRGLRLALRARVHFVTPYVGILAEALAAAPVGAAEDAPGGRFPVSLEAGWDTPLGTGGLTVGAETAGGWGIGAGIGFKDATPGTIHTLVGVNLRAPIVRRGPFDLGALLWLSGGGRETEVHHPAPGQAWFMRWQWQTAYRLDAAASARLRLGTWAVRLDAGVGYILNPPRCEYIDTINNVNLAEGDCADPIIPAAENATSPWVRVTPFFALAGEYDIAAAFTGGSASGAPDGQGSAASAEPVVDGRESNAWLAPTALTLGRGKVRVTAYEGIAPELAIGVTDRFQASAAFGFFGSIYAYKTELKLGLLRQGRLRLALLAGSIGLQAENDFGLALWGGGGAASVCLDERCQSMVSVAVLAGVLIEHSEGGVSHRSLSAVVSPNLVLALGPRAKLVVEVHASGEVDDPIAIALLRLPFRHLSLELGVISGGRFVVPAGTVSWTF